MCDRRQTTPSISAASSRTSSSASGSTSTRTGDDIVYCDGSGDGGIDVASSNAATPTTRTRLATHGSWCQASTGSAFAGARTLRDEGHEIIDTLDGRRNRLSSLAEGLLDHLLELPPQRFDRDRMVVLFATEDPLTEDERNTITDLRTVGRERLGARLTSTRSRSAPSRT